MGFYRKEWASKDAIVTEVADVPENWLRGFAVRHPRDFRKFAAKRNGSAMYRVSAVLKAIEDGEGMPNDGIVEVPFAIGAGERAGEMGDGADNHQRTSELMELSVNEIGLSVRATNCLNNAQISTVGELVTKTEADLINNRNFGKKSITEIKAKLVQLGLSLRSFDEWRLNRRQGTLDD